MAGGLAASELPVPASRFHELIALATENDGLVTAEDARRAGFTDSVLSRLAQRGKLERTARGVYRVSLLPLERFSQYREIVLWAKANRGPADVAISHETALVLYGISDANPAAIHLTVPAPTRLRRRTPRGVIVHYGHLPPEDTAVHEGIPVTSVRRTINDLLESNSRPDLVRQAISDARREGFITDPEARQLRRRIDTHSISGRVPTEQRAS